MARVPYAGVPDEAPSLEAPQDYQHIEASPASFGEPLARGAEALGQGLMQASHFYSQVAADNATNNYLEQEAKILHGDPTKMVIGPDGKPAPDTGFFGLRGADAMKARPEVQQQLDDLIAQERESLSTPMARHQYDTETRRYRAKTLGEVGAYADQQQKAWALSTNETSANLALNQVARVAGDDAASTAAGEQVRSAYVKSAQIAGDDTRGAVLKADQAVALTRVRALMGANQPLKAQQVFDASGDLLGSLPNYDQIERQVKEGVFNAVTTPNVDQDVAAALAGAQKAASSGQTSGAPPAGVTAPAPKGPIYDQIGKAASAAGATAAESAFLTREAQIESNGDPGAQKGTSTGLFQFKPGTFARMGGADIRDVGQQTTAALKLMRQNAAILKGAGVEPTDANLYIMHQQGAGGGRALLTAPSDVSAVAVLAPVYEHQGVTSAQATAEATAAITANGGSPDMTAGQFIALWRGKWGGAGAPAGGAHLSTADALRENMPSILAQAQAKAEKLFPNFPDYQARYVETVQRRLDQTISQQDEQYKVDTHIVASVMAGPNAPISEDQLVATSPEVARAWRSMQVNNPYGAMAIERMFDANAKGKALGYGSEFKSYLDRALAPAANPDRIGDASQLWGFVGKGDDAALTNSGANTISQLLAIRGTPGGEAFAAQTKSFIDQMHAELTFSNAGTGVVDHKGEALYSRFLAQALPILENAYKTGTVAKVLDPKSPDYLGNLAQTFMRPPAQIMADKLADTGSSATLPPYTAASLNRTLDSLDDDAQRQEALKAAVAQHRIDLATATLIAQQRGYVQGGLAPGMPPAPPMEAPPPVPAAAALHMPGLQG